jgi:hypothetical protein
MKILENIIMIVVFIVAGSFFVVRYVNDSHNGNSGELLRKNYVSPISLSDAGISELPDSLSIISVNDPWEALDFKLMSTEKDSTSLSQYRGSFVLLNFWTTW